MATHKKGPFAKRWVGDKVGQLGSAKSVSVSTSRQTEIARRLYHAGVALWTAVVAQGATPPIEGGTPKMWIAKDNDRATLLAHLSARNEQGEKLYPCGSLEREYNSILNECLAANQGLIRLTMRKFIRRAEAVGLTKEDLEQEGYLGVLKTVQKYDPDKSAFSTYLYFWIYQSMNRAVQNASLIHTPPNRKAIPEGETLEGLDLAVHRARSPLSMNQEVQNGNKSASVSAAKELGDLIEDFYTPNPEEALSVRQDERNLLHARSFLTPREDRVLVMRYAEDLTLQEAGEAIGLTRERIRQIECAALESLRDRLDPDEANLLALCDKD